MRPFLIAGCIAGLSILSPLSWAQRTCPVTVAASVEVAGAEFSLADLLAPETCPTLRREAASMRLGGVPLAGSVRVIEGNEVRALLNQLAVHIPPKAGAPASLRVPERITVRRAGSRASCGDIERRIVAALRAAAPDSASGDGDRQLPHAGNPPSQDMDCGAAGRIPREAPIELTRAAWNATLGTWDASARCLHPADCVPFLVRLPAGPRTPQSQPRTGNSAPALRSASSQTLVRPGKTVTLLWDQDGIRLVVPAICLDRGGVGEPVRARIVHGGRVVRAIVESAGTVRAAS